MNTVEKKVRALRWRLDWLGFCRRFVRLLLAALCLSAAYVAVERFVRVPVAPATVVYWLLIATFPLSLLLTLAKRTTVRHAAIAADLRLGLRERLSTAISIGSPRTAMEEAVLADAEAHAKGLRARRVFPMPVWRDLYFLPIPVLLIVSIGLFVPRLDLFGQQREEEGDAALATEAQRRLARRLEAFQQQLNRGIERRPAVQLRQVSDEMQQLLRRLRSGQQPVGRAEVLKRLSRIGDRLAERKAEMEKKLAAARRAEMLRSSSVLTSGICEALAKGNFEKAASQMKRLMGDLKSGGLSQEQKEQLAKELSQLAKALRENRDLCKALSSAAAELAANDVAAAAEGLRVAAGELADLADLLNQLAQLEGLQRSLEGVRAMQAFRFGGRGDSCCSTGEGNGDLSGGMGEFRPGDTDVLGPGMGGAGRGRGGRARFAETSTRFTPRALRMKLDKGEIIGVISIWGHAPRGQVRTEFERAYMEYRQSAEDALARERIPLEYRTLVRDYFDAIRPTAQADNPAPRATGGQARQGAQP